MRAWIIPKGCVHLDQLRVADRPDPTPGAYQVIVRVRACSLNYRDQAVVSGHYFGGVVGRDTVPLSDGAGEVVSVGEGVTRFSSGDRVAATFFQPAAPADPRTALGSPLDGMLAELVAIHEDGLVRIPAAYSYAQAACLPCAGVTAWHALFHAGRPIKAGDLVLVLGTGGVSMWALQLARAAGAGVVVTSSSDEKLDRAREMGAMGLINYRRTPEWDQEVRKVTEGRGVDGVIEVGGAGTFGRSVRSLARGGKMALIGFLAGREGDTNPYSLTLIGGSLHGIFVGDREMFEELARAVAVNRIEPVIDRVFLFDEAREAFKHHASGAFIGKVVIAV